LKVVETATPPAGWKAAGGQEYDLAPDAEKNVAGKTIQTGI